MFRSRTLQRFTPGFFVTGSPDRARESQPGGRNVWRGCRRSRLRGVACAQEVVTSRLALYRQPGEAGTLQWKQIARWLLPLQQAHYVLHEDQSCEAFS